MPEEKTEEKRGRGRPKKTEQDRILEKPREASHETNVKRGRPENLTPFTSERAKIVGAKGGKKAAERRAKRKQFAEICQLMLGNRVTKAQAAALVAQLGYEKKEAEDLTQQAMAVAGMVNAAVGGDVRAFETLERLTDDPEDGKNGKKHIDLDNIADTYHPLIRKIRRAYESPEKCNLELVLKGGRASTKSSAISQEIIELIKNNPSMHAMVIRKVAATLRDSVYNQIKWALEVTGEHLENWECTVSPMQIKYKPTGQTIYFSGLDKSEKLKSTKPASGYIGIIWFEEASDLYGPNEKRSVEQSLKRGGDKYFEFLSYNPPASADNWINTYALESRPEKIVHHSTYLDCPPEWVGDAFIADAEWLRSVNPTAYEHEILGIATGTGANVFPNIEVRPLTQQEKDSCTYVLCGNDWGYSSDPNAFNAVSYDPRTMTLYILDERHAVHCSNETWAEMLQDYLGYDVESDSAAPKDNDWMSDRGFRFHGVKKGQSSVEQGLRVMSRFAKIVIDADKCPETAKEFSTYEYIRDKDGNITAKVPDKDNHHIDAVRYALTDIINNPRYR